MIDAKYDLNEVLESTSDSALEQAARGATWVYSRGTLGAAIWPFTAYATAACLSELRRRRELQPGEALEPRPRALPVPGSIPKKPEARRVLLSAALDMVTIAKAEAQEPEDHEVARLFEAALEVFEIVLAEAELEASTVQ